MSELDLDERVRRLEWRVTHLEMAERERQIDSDAAQAERQFQASRTLPAEPPVPASLPNAAQADSPE